MPFKGISYLELWQPFVQRSVTICAILVKGIQRNNSVKIILNLGQSFGSRCCLKGFLPGALAAHMLGGSNHLCNFGRGHHGEHSCEVICNLDQWFKRRCGLKTFLILSSGSPFVQCTGTICAIFEEGIKRNYFEFGPVVQEEMPFKGISYLELWQPFCSAGHNNLCNFGREYQVEQF